MSTARTVSACASDPAPTPHRRRRPRKSTGASLRC
jgi:hypothetical protein